MKQEVLFIILNEYADWESAFLAASLHSGLMPGSEIKYVVKTVAPTLDAVRLNLACRRWTATVFRQTRPAHFGGW